MTSPPTLTHRDETASPFSRHSPAADALTSRPVDLAMVVGGAGFLIAGLAWPQAAGALLQMLFVALGVGFLATRAYRFVQPVKSTEDLFSPFDDHPTARSPAVAPRALRKLVLELRGADDPRSAQRKAVPASALRTAREEATRRLAEHHGLSLRDPAHHHRIRALVSDPTWQAIHPHDAASGPVARSTSRPTVVPLCLLGPILDDLERL